MMECNVGRLIPFALPSFCAGRLFYCLRGNEFRRLVWDKHKAVTTGIKRRKPNGMKKSE